MLCAVIMAGGKGERFWPLSTDEKPKQFLKLLGEETMLQMTISRLLPIIPIENIFVVTGKSYTELVTSQLPRLPKENIIIEPCGRNTAPCIALSALYISNKFEDATMIVLPSDHMIENEEEFRKIILKASKFVQQRNEALVTIGIEPNRPETGYGYIKAKIENNYLRINDIYKVDAFKEKPDINTAKEYLKYGDYLWNSGMFMWKASTILRLTSKYLKNTFDVLSEIASDADHYEELLERNYKKTDSISIDYGILEKADDIYVIPGDIGWDDVGSWYSVERYMDKDDKGNVCIGNVLSLDSYNNIIYSKGKPIVTAGLQDLFLIETEDMIFITTKEKISKIKEIKKSVI